MEVHHDELNEDPFRWVKEEIEVLQGQYSKLEAVIKEVSKLLGDCKARNICKELKKLKKEDKSVMQAYNTELKLLVTDL